MILLAFFYKIEYSANSTVLKDLMANKSLLFTPKYNA